LNRAAPRPEVKGMTRGLLVESASAYSLILLAVCRKRKKEQAAGSLSSVAGTHEECLLPAEPHDRRALQRSPLDREVPPFTRERRQVQFLSANQKATEHWALLKKLSAAIDCRYRLLLAN
jgi:hypothetical protein